MTSFNYPKWNQLPEMDLYLDQILLYVNQVTYHGIAENDKGLTAAMVNNYVKHGQLAKPIKKKYNRQQLARLIVITSLKPVFSIQDITQTLNLLTADGLSQEAYDAFVACMNEMDTSQLPQVIVSACHTLKLYYQTQSLVLELKNIAKEGL